MNGLYEIVAMGVPLLAGVGIGLVYFGGLWLTVRQAPRVRHPAPLFLASFVLRTGICVAGFLIAMNGRWEWLLASLVGFVLGRTVLIRQSRERAATDRAR